MNHVQILSEVSDFLSRHHGHFIDGQQAASTSTQRIEIVNPATAKSIATVSQGNRADVEKAVNSAYQAFKTDWAQKSPYEKGQCLNKLADLVEAHAEELAQLETLNSGKVIQISRHLEVAQSIIFFRYFAGWATKITGQTMQPSIPSMSGEQYSAYTVREPVGVVAGIVPWNFSLMIGVWKIASALTTGCTIVLKPSEFTPLSLLRLAELAIEAGIPKGVINIVTGNGETGQLLIQSPRVKKVSFTGSVPTGIEIGKLAMSSDLTRVSLELGGKNAVAILQDADIDLHLPSLLRSTFVHQGQVCAAPERFYVHRQRYDEFVEKCSAALGEFKIGSPLDETVHFGPLSNALHFKKVKHYLDLASEQQQIIAGGEVLEREGFYVQPTLVHVTSQNDPLYQEEVFGPVIAIIPFDDEDTLVEQMNAGRFGLTASIWSNNLSQVMRLIPRLDVGTVWVNMHTFLDPSVPFGGRKASGIGREFSDTFIHDYTEMKSVMMCF